MENKLQELTNKLYEEGLVKGRTEADALLSKAQEEANNLVEKAKTQAAAILAGAQQEAAEHKEQVDNEIRMASRQTLAELKQKIENIVVFKSLDAPTKQAMTDKEFVQGLINTLVDSFNPKGADAIDLNVALPDEQKDDFSTFLKAQLAKIFNSNVTVTFTSDLENGFTIGPKDGSYQIRFSDKDFVALFSQYLRPKTQKLLYGE